MTKSKLALDSQTERELLLDLWNIEEMAERGNLDAVKEQLATLIEEIRFSEVIQSYKLFDVLDDAREEDLLETISSTVKNTPNDMELGREIRQLFNA